MVSFDRNSTIKVIDFDEDRSSYVESPTEFFRIAITVIIVPIIIVVFSVSGTVG